MPVKRKIYGVMPMSVLIVRWLPWFVFVLSLFITCLLWKNANEHKRHVAKAYFEAHARDAEEQIKKRLGTYEQVLRGLKGLMVSSEVVTRDEFKAYVSSLDLQKHYPGIQALAFVKAVPAEEKEKHIQSVRKEGFPEYSIVPPGDRPFYAPIVYLECFSDISLYDIGFDTCSDPVRREVMDKSRLIGDVVISDKVNLVQTDTGRIYPGFLMYFPVYKWRNPYLENTDGGSEYISGWVTAPFLMEYLMPGLLEDSSTGLEISIYDGESEKKEALMYDSAPEEKHAGTSIFESANVLNISNHKWLVKIRALPAFKAGIEEENTNAFIYAGVVIGILMSLLVHALVSGKFRAEQLVRERTEALKENETLLELALEGSVIGMWDWNIKTGQTHYNDNWAGLVGYKLKELTPLSIKTWLDLCHPDDIQISKAALEKHFRGESPFYECELRMRHKNGSWIWVLDRGSVSEWSPDGKPLRMVGTHIDITRRKQMEIELSDKTALLTNLLNSIPDIVFLKDMNGVYLGCNPAFTRFVGVSEEKVIGHTDHDIFPKHVADEFRKHDKLVTAGGKACSNEEWLTYPDGRKVIVDTIKSPLRSAGGECIGILGVARDITARKLAEDEIHYHSKLSQMLVEISDKFINMQPENLNDHFFNTLRQIGEFVNVDRCYIFMFSHENETMSNICEWVRPGFKLQHGNFQNTPTKDFKYWMDKLRNNETVRLENLKDLPPEAEAERRILEAQNIKSMLIVPISEKGVLTGFLGFDSITESHVWPEEIIILMRMVADIVSNAFLQKTQLEQLSQAGKNFDTFFNTIDDLLFVLSSEGTILHVNDTASRRLGYSKDEMIGRNIVMVHSEKDRAEAMRIVGDMISGKTLFCPLPVIAKNGLAIPVETRVVKGEWNGKPALFGVTKDISQLKLSEQKFSGIFQQTSVLMSISRISDGMFIDVNEAFLSAFGFTRDEAIGKTSFELNIFNDPSDRDKVKAMFERDGKIRGIEITMRKRDGTLMTGLFGAVPINISEDACWLTSVVDISELKMTEEKLRDSEEKFRLLLDSTGEGIYGLDMDGNCTFCNKSALSLLGYKLPEDLLGKNMHWAIHHHRHSEEDPFPLEECRIFQALNQHSGTHVDDEILWRADGTSFPAEYWAYPQHQGGKQIGAVVTFYDITERKETEHQIKQNLREKEMLLREIHHRVKNNMAVISSLLALQADATSDMSAKEMLEESQQRIKSMALVHEKLYRSKNIANIDFHDYVSTIVMELSSAYAHEGRSVETGVTADDVILDVDTAIPCGLILNELVTNAFKYAFRSKGEGRIDVSFTHDAHHSCTLIVKDNGIGLPPGFDHSKSNTLGLQIVSALTKQLRGTMHVDSVPGTGTEITVKFKNRGSSHGTEKHTDS